MSKGNAKTVYLLRHGETDISVTGAYCGSANGKLTETGRVQAAAWANCFSRIDDLEIISSDFPRAIETTQEISPTFKIDPTFREWDLGALEGKNSLEYRLQNPTWNLFEDGPPGGESILEIEKRAGLAISKILNSPKSNLLIVTHGQFMKVLIQIILEVEKLSDKIKIGPARLTILKITEDKKAVFLAHNATPIEQIKIFEESAS